MDCPVPGVTTRPAVNTWPVLTTPTVVGTAHKAALAAGEVAAAFDIFPAALPATTTEKLTR